MRKALVTSMMIAAAAIATPAMATVVNFDDLTGGGTVPDGYNGINFNGNFSYYDSVQSPYTPSSVPTRIYSNYAIHAVGVADVLTFNFLSPVVFQGLFTAGAGIGTVSYDLFLGGSLKGSSGSVVTSATPYFLASGYSGLIDEVRINAFNGYAVYDDFTFSGTPEPATWALMLLGFGAIGVSLRRSAKSRGQAQVSYDFA